MSRGDHIVDNKFQSDKFPETPRGIVPLKVSDPVAQPFLWGFAQAHRAIDPDFSDDLEECLRLEGYEHTPAIEREPEHLFVPRDGTKEQMRAHGYWFCVECWAEGHYIAIRHYLTNCPDCNWPGQSTVCRCLDPSVETCAVCRPPEGAQAHG